MIKLIDILNEAKIISVGIGKILPTQDIEIIELLTKDFAEDWDFEDFDLYKPFTKTYSLEDYCRDFNYYEDYCIAIRTLLKKYPKGAKFVSNDIQSIGGIILDPSINPSNKFGVLIEIDSLNEEVNISSPWVEAPWGGMIGNLFRNVGWFDQLGNYHPDTKNFNEGGVYIGG
jgi:hypothetical protein